MVHAITLQENFTILLPALCYSITSLFIFSRRVQTYACLLNTGGHNKGLGDPSRLNALRWVQPTFSMPLTFLSPTVMVIPEVQLGLYLACSMIFAHHHKAHATDIGVNQCGVNKSPKTADFPHGTRRRTSTTLKQSSV